MIPSEIRQALAGLSEFEIGQLAYERLLKEFDYDLVHDYARGRFTLFEIVAI